MDLPPQSIIYLVLIYRFRLFLRDVIVHGLLTVKFLKFQTSDIRYTYIYNILCFENFIFGVSLIRSLNVMENGSFDVN